MQGKRRDCRCEEGAMEGGAQERERKRRRKEWRREELSPKRLLPPPPPPAGEAEREDYFDRLPDDLVVCILCKLSSSAACPFDLISALSSCKRFNVLGFHQMVLSKASARALAVRAKNWSDSAHRFLKRCVDAGNFEAHFILGLIRFYCLQKRGSGAALMAKAAINSHPSALYSLAVIQFNGSGGTKNDKDLRAGVALCARAAFLGHIDALRELGHCLQDGYGVRRNVPEGRRFLIQANARELAAAFPFNPAAATSWPGLYQLHRQSMAEGEAALNSTAVGDIAVVAAYQPPVPGSLVSDYGWSLPAPEPHPANRFLAEWFGERGGSEALPDGLRLCSHRGCGRPETRRHEFRRCSVCGTVNYCSRACQALDWKLSHKTKCAPMDRWLLEDGDAAAVDDGGDVAVAGNGGPLLE